MKSFFFSVLCLLFLSCSKKKINLSNESIEVYYMRPGVMSLSYSCGAISKEALMEEIHCKEFKDSAVITKFSEIYNKYEIEPNPDENINARIRVIIKTKKIKDTLCLGEGLNTFINGVKYKDNKEMYSFITELIDYKNTPRPKRPWDKDK